MAERDALRVELGGILADEDPSIFDLLTSMATATPAESDEEILARYILGRLAAQGWQITRQDADPGPCPGGCDPEGLVSLARSVLCERCGTISPAVRL
jgi:hypothetical protein